MPQKGRAQGDVLGPVEEVVGFLFVENGLRKIGHGLAAPQADFTAEAQARHRQGHREGQADLLRSRAELGLLPSGRRRFPVRREALRRFFLRRRAEIIQANIVPGDAGEQFPFIHRTVYRGVLFRPILVRLDGLPRWNPEGIEDGQSRAGQKLKFRDVAAPGQGHHLHEVILERVRLAPVPFRFQTCKLVGHERWFPFHDRESACLAPRMIMPHGFCAGKPPFLKYPSASRCTADPRFRRHAKGD